MTQALRRRIARALARHAAQVMPRSDLHWDMAMQNEVEAIADDGDALSWAIGCVKAGYWERSNALLQTGHARACLACLIVLLATREFFAPVLIWAYRMKYMGLAHFLGLRTAGDDYRRLIPVMDATPSWLAALWVAAGLLYLVALWRMLRRVQGSTVLFFVATGFDLFGIGVVQSIQVSTGIVITPNPLVRTGGVVLTFAVGLLLWRTNRRPAPAVS